MLKSVDFFKQSYGFKHLMIIVMKKNVPIATLVIWTRISSQQTQVLKWNVLLEFTLQEMMDI